METYIAATLGGLSAIVIAAAIVLGISSGTANPPFGPSAIEETKELKARGSGRDEENVLISNTTDEDPPPKKTKTEVATTTAKAGQTQPSEKDATHPPNPGDTRTED